MIDHRMRVVKKTDPTIITVGIMSSKAKPSQYLSPLIDAELIDTYAYFIDSTLQNLIPYIKKASILNMG